MNVWKKMAPFERRELYYFDTTKEFEAAELAARLYTMIQEELEKRGFLAKLQDYEPVDF